MIFINPKTDFAFKKIFGSEKSHGVLISFLNGILYGGRSIIEDLTILNPYQAPRIRGVKDTYLDVKAKLHSGETVIIEMQVLNVEGFEKRILYNATKSYAMQFCLHIQIGIFHAPNPWSLIGIENGEIFNDRSSTVKNPIEKANQNSMAFFRPKDLFKCKICFGIDENHS